MLYQSFGYYHLFEFFHLLFEALLKLKESNKNNNKVKELCEQIVDIVPNDSRFNKLCQ